MKQVIYFTYDANCPFCDDFRETAEQMAEYYDDRFMKLECRTGDNRKIAKHIFGVKTLPSVVVVENKKFTLIEDISRLSLVGINELIDEV